MAELTIGTNTIVYNKDGVAKSFTIPRVAVNLASGILAAGTKAVPITATEITGLPATPGLCLLINRDATNYAVAGVTTASLGVKIFPYDSAAPDLSFALFPLAGATLYVSAAVTTCNIDYVVFPIAS